MNFNKFCCTRFVLSHRKKKKICTTKHWRKMPGKLLMSTVCDTLITIYLLVINSSRIILKKKIKGFYYFFFFLFNKLLISESFSSIQYEVYLYNPRKRKKRKIIWNHISSLSMEKIFIFIVMKFYSILSISSF